MKAAAAATLALLLAGSTTSAQDAGAGADAFVGYSLLAKGGGRHGWHAALAWPLGARTSLLVDLSGHGGAEEGGTDVDTLALLAGPRVSFGRGRLRPFVHVIAGLLRTRRGVEVFGVDIGETSDDLAGAAGGGVDLGLAARWALRGLADYRVARSDGETSGDPRVSLGVVYRFRR